MKKNDERLNHALHNEKVCNHLELAQEFSDWVITTAFYSALHFVSYKIFPFQVPGMGDKRVLINTIDEFYNYNSAKGIKKHKLLSDLVYKNCQEISEEYDWLLSMSMNARYSNYQQDKIIASKARNLMNTIKSKCL